jgi:hypothetical protein
VREVRMRRWALNDDLEGINWRWDKHCLSERYTIAFGKLREYIADGCCNRTGKRSTP